MDDILTLTKKVLDLFEEADLSKMQGMFVIKAVKLSLLEEVIKDAQKGPNFPGVQ